MKILNTLSVITVTNKMFSTKLQALFFSRKYIIYYFFCNNTWYSTKWRLAMQDMSFNTGKEARHDYFSHVNDSDYKLTSQ